MSGEPIYHALAAEHGILCPASITYAAHNYNRQRPVRCDRYDGHEGAHTVTASGLAWTGPPRMLLTMTGSPAVADQRGLLRSSHDR